MNPYLIPVSQPIPVVRSVMNYREDHIPVIFLNGLNTKSILNNLILYL